MEKIHFEIKQKSEERITSIQLEMISRLLDYADDTSIFEGTLVTDVAYTETLDKLRNDPRCANLAVTATIEAPASTSCGGVIPEQNSDDPAVGRWLNELISDIILAQSYTIVIDEEHKCYASLSATDGMKFADGTPWSGLYGNAMKFFPRVYYHGEKNVQGQWQYLFSLAPIDDDPSHVWESAFIGTYLAGYEGGKLCSRPNVEPKASITMSQFDIYAKLNGNDYGLWHYPDWLKLNALQLAKYGTRDCKKAVSRGLCDGGNGYYGFKTGTTSAFGDGTGETPVSGNIKQFRMFGLEALWGQLWQFLPGIRFESGGSSAVVYPGNIVSNIANGRTFAKLNNANGQYTQSMALGEHFDLVQTAVGASETKAWTTGCWANGIGQLLLVGGTSYHGSLCGLSCSSSNNAFSNSYANFGSRLAFYGSLDDYEQVSGADMVAKNR